MLFILAGVILLACFVAVAMFDEAEG